MKTNKQKMILTVGLPGSGKTYWTRTLLESNPNLVRVNRDDLRDLISAHNYRYTQVNENIVTKLQQDLIVHYIREGKDIIIDDTNLNKGTVNKLHRIAQRYDLGLELKSFLDVDLDLCVERAKNRIERPVDKDVIMTMFNKYIKGKNLNEIIKSLLIFDDGIKTPPVYRDFWVVRGEPLKIKKDTKHIIVDIDGTIANHHGIRDVYDGSKVIHDLLIENVANVVKNLSKNYNIWFVSGRDGKYVNETMEWIDLHFGISQEVQFYDKTNYQGLIMRGVDDNRDDTIVKQEIYNIYFKDRGYEVMCAFDDRDRVVDMWRRNGITCMQVNYGNF
jgi:predicted kinase